MNMGVRGAWKQSDTSKRGGRTLGALAGIWLCLAIVGCAGGTAGGTPPTATTGASASATAGGATPTPVTTSSGPTPTPFGFGTPSAIQGTTDACAQTTATPTASLPSNIPAYPNAQLSIGSTNSGSGVFGLCASDTVDAVTGFYSTQLPAHGWQNLTNTTLQASRQLTANQGSTNLIITISPDTSIQGKTEVLIIYSGTPGA